MPLVKILGERVSLSKVSEKQQDKFQDIIPEHKLIGYLTLYNRGGGPAVFVSSLSEWFATSWVVNVCERDGQVEIETQNSIYQIKTL